MAESTVVFVTDQADPTSFADEPKVGSIYEVGINGVGYMLADSPQLKYERSTTPIEAPKFYTSNVPFDERIDHYGFSSYFDWSGGAGQVQGDRSPNSVDNAFYDSDGIDPFTNKFQISLQHATSLILSSAYTNPLAVVASDALYQLTSNTQLTYETTPGGGTTNIALTGAQVVTALASDGQYWYAAHGGTANGIARGTTAATLNWSAIVAEGLWFAGQRICAAVKAGASSTPNRFTTLADAGTEEVAGGRMTLPEGWTIVKGTGGGGYVYFGAYSGDVGLIYKWQVGSSGAPTVALELPKGHIPIEVFWYQGQVLVRTRRPTTGGGAQAVIFRCPASASDGTLSLFQVATIGSLTTATDYSSGSFAASEKFVFFSWSLQDGTHSGLGAIDLVTGGYCKWLRATSATGHIPAVLIWRGKLAFTSVASGTLYEQDTYVTSGFLKESLSDRGSVQSKAYDTVAVNCAPLAASEQIDVAYSFDAGVTFTTLTAANMSATGLVAKTTTLDKKARSIGIKLTLTGPATTTPTVYLSSVRYHMLALADTIIKMPINCADGIDGLNDQPLPESTNPGSGAARARLLESLAQTRVRLQDIDWGVTHTSETWDVIQVDVSNTSVADRQTNRNALAQVALVTLRKRAK